MGMASHRASMPLSASAPPATFAGPQPPSACAPPPPSNGPVAAGGPTGTQYIAGLRARMAVRFAEMVRSSLEKAVTEMRPTVQLIFASDLGRVVDIAGELGRILGTRAQYSTRYDDATASLYVIIQLYTS